MLEDKKKRAGRPVGRSKQYWDVVFELKICKCRVDIKFHCWLGCFVKGKTGYLFCFQLIVWLEKTVFEKLY